MYALSSKKIKNQVSYIQTRIFIQNKKKKSNFMHSYMHCSKRTKKIKFYAFI